jgi:hypothetical protein
MPLTNAEKQKRYRDRRNALAHWAEEQRAFLGCCVFCLIERDELEADGRTVAEVGRGRVVFCDECVEKAAAAIGGAKLRARRAGK